MKQWNGLLKKEWATMSGHLYATVGVSLLFSLLIPFCSTLFNWGLGFLEFSLILSAVWMGASVLIPTVILLVSLGKEMGRPDIWLHSTASIFKMFGSKAIFAGFVGAMNMLIPVIIIVIESRFTGFPVALSFKVIFEIGGLLFFVLYMMSLLVMCTGLFFGVLYQLIKPVMRGFAIPNVVILFLFSAWIFERIASTSAYEKVTSFGPIIGPGEGVLKVGKGDSYFTMDETVFYTGEILFDLLVAVILFATAVVLFEKKVRI